MRYTNVSTTDFAQFLTRVGLAGSVRDVEAICGLWATAGKGEWAFTGVDVSEFAAAAADGRKRRGIPLSQHFQERKDEILSIFAGLDAAQPASPASPARATGASLVRSNSLLGNAGPVSTHARRPSIPSPLLGDLSNKSSPPPTSQDLPTPSAPTTTWWTPGNVENKIGIQMSPAEWLKRCAFPSPDEANADDSFADTVLRVCPRLPRSLRSTSPEVTRRTSSTMALLPTTLMRRSRPWRRRPWRTSERQEIPGIGFLSALSR